MTCQQSAGSNRLRQQFAAITSITAIGHSMTRAFGWISCFHLSRVIHQSKFHNLEERNISIIAMPGPGQWTSSDWMPRIQHEDMAAKEVLASWISRIRFKKGLK